MLAFDPIRDEVQVIATEPLDQAVEQDGIAVDLAGQVSTLEGEVHRTAAKGPLCYRLLLAMTEVHTAIPASISMPRAMVVYPAPPIDLTENESPHPLS
ncbi:hypothetical protein [Nonomuraea cavernae]|uniref:hypothetical protein n=1 Tax=Nonomuraea cavernae TaxID=2045107 RepID=UPI0033CECAD0